MLWYVFVGMHEIFKAFLVKKKVDLLVEISKADLRNHNAVVNRITTVALS